MKPERWRRIESIFHKALEAEESRRAAVLDESCGEYIHFFDFVEEGTPFYRVRVSEHKLILERIEVVSLSRGMVKGQFGQWTGLAPDDSPLLLHDTSFQEIYALDLQLR